MNATLSLAVAIFLATLGSGRAETVQSTAVEAADRSAIVACLRDSAQTPRACIGSIAVACARGSTERRGSPVACSRREAGVWRERLDLAVRVFGERLESGQKGRFAALQQSWEGYAAQKCAFLSGLQPEAQGLTVQAACELQEAATRAIEVERMLRRQTAPASPRPRIER
ncbi:MAG TPA: lysozyme inhibitor LprI family protein [Beijerinckiaceae bacterium]|jgi:hypothetical protein